MARPVLIYEFELDDLLADPLVALLMSSDRVTPEAVREEMYALRGRMTRRQKAARSALR